MIIPLTTACLMLAAQTYSVPPATLYGLMSVEGGWEGLAKPNRDKWGNVVHLRDGRVSEDLNRFQVNSVWVHTFTQHWNQPDDRTTYTMLRDNGCASAFAASAIVRYHLGQTDGDLDRAVAIYHTGPKGSAAEAAKYLEVYHYVLNFGRLPPKRSRQ